MVHYETGLAAPRDWLRRDDADSAPCNTPRSALADEGLRADVSGVKATSRFV
jgi:hypothetical protein